MKRNTVRSIRSQAGFTLIEVLVVMAIIVAVAGLGLTSFNYVQSTKKKKTADIQVQAMSNAVAEMKLKESLFPGDGTEQSSAVLYQMISGDRDSDGQLDPNTTAYLGGIAGAGKKAGYDISNTLEIIDPYGEPYRYQFPGVRNAPNEADIWSVGPDGLDNTADDIKNW